MRCRYQVLLTAFVSLPLIATAQAPAVSSLSWMTGCWRFTSANTTVDEMWMVPDGETMLGTGRTVRGGRTVEYEFMRIYARGDSLVYAAMPSGQQPAEFVGVPQLSRALVVSNATHDFPQRISYRMTSDSTLEARVEGSIAGRERAQVFPYRRIACVAGVASAQQPAGRAAPATVRVAVVDSASTLPIKRAGVQAEGWMGIAFTDSSGRFRMRNVPLQSELRIRCPSSRRFAGRITYRQSLNLSAGADTQIVARISAPECQEPPVRSVQLEMRGHYTSGFEESSFKPCVGLPPEGTVYGVSDSSAWVRFADPLRGRQPKWPSFPDSVYYPTVYVRWRGILTGPGGYGHLGVATYEFLVNEILEFRRPRSSDCHRP